MVFHILLILCQAHFKLTAAFPYGMSSYPPLVFDSDHDSTPELFIISFADTGTMVCEHIGNNQYINSRLFGINIHAVGYGDEDSLTDAYVHVAIPPSYIDPIGIFESRSYNTYPDSGVWWLVDSTPRPTIGYFVDFDQDSYMDLIAAYHDNNYISHFCLIENTGDNSYTQTFEYDFPSLGPAEMTIDDFDGDGLLEIVCGDIDAKVYVFENTAIGVDSFQLVWTYQLPSGFANAYYTARGNDMDGDENKEFIVGANAYDRWCFTMFETRENNSYQKIWQYFYYYGGSLTYGDIDCGDIDGDGIDEMVTFGGLMLNVWKCVGPDSFVSIWDRWYMGDLCDGVLLVHDLNQNGLGEVVVSGLNWGSTPRAKTYIYEKMPTVNWIYPARYDTLWANDTVNLRWKLDEIVSLESLRIYIAHPLMGCWQIYQGLPQDTSCIFVVPDTQSYMAFKFWVAVQGYLRYDSIVSPPFYIKRRTGIEETVGWKEKDRIGLWVSPNPFTTKLNIRCMVADMKYGIPNEHISDVSHPPLVSLKIYDASGRLIHSFPIQHFSDFHTILWDGTDEFGRKHPAGVYFVLLEANDCKQIEKVMLLR